VITLIPLAFIAFHIVVLLIKFGLCELGLCLAQVTQAGSRQRAALPRLALITSSSLLDGLTCVCVWRRPSLPLQETEQLVQAGKPHSLAGGWTFEGRPPDQLARALDLPQTYQVGYVISAFSAHLTHPLLG
jgi:hypothetical protein